MDAKDAQRTNAVCRLVIGSAMKVHTALGAGLLESAYHKCLCRQLMIDGLHFQNQVKMPIVYDGIELQGAYWIDFIVENCLVVEIKAVETVLPVHFAQVLSYLRLSGHKLGLLINFNVPHLRDGIRRVVNGLDQP